MGFLDNIKSWVWGSSPQTENTQEESQPQSYSEAGIEAFRSDNWDMMDEDEKIESLQQLSDDYSAEIGLSNPPSVVRETNANNYGGYVESTNQVKVNLDNCSNPYEAVDTVIHEDNHAYQAEAINSTLQNGSRYSEGEIAVLRAENTNAGYISTNDIRYDVQSIELDSNNAGLRYVTDHCSGMSDDPAYYDYMTNRDKHFHRVNAGLSNTDAVNAQETGQVNDAFRSGAISEAEANQANEAIVYGKTTFRTAAAESGEIAHQECIDASISRSKQLHAEFNNGTAVKAQDRQECINYMKEGLAQSQEELKTLKAEQNEYICSNNMGFREVAADETCREFRSKIEACEHQADQYKSHISELSTDAELSQQGGLSQGSESLVSGLGESVSSKMDNGQSM